MTYQDLFYYYSIIPTPTNKWNIFRRGCSAIKRYIIRKSVLHYFSNKMLKEGASVAEGVIISLTSFPARLNTLWQCVESLKRQSVIPEKIMLFLSKDQISYKELPSSLTKLEDDLFEIHMVDGDIRSHKKYYYAMNEFPGKVIVTTDDDVIYPPFMLSSLLEAHLKYPKDVVANYTHVIKIENGKVAPYIEWYDIPATQNLIDTTINQIQVGIGGVLYPPNSLYEDVLNMDIAKELSFLADDLWLYAQTILGGNRVVKTRLNKKTIIPIKIENDITLTNENVLQNKNDMQFQNLRNYYLKRNKIDIVRKCDI